MMNNTLPLTQLPGSQNTNMAKTNMRSISPSFNGNGMFSMNGQSIFSNLSSSRVDQTTADLSAITNATSSSPLMGIATSNGSIKTFPHLMQHQGIIQVKQNQIPTPNTLGGLLNSTGMYNTFPNDAASLKSTSLLLQNQFMMNRSPLNVATASQLLACSPTSMNIGLSLSSATNPTSGMSPLPSPSSLFKSDDQRKRGGVIEPFPEKLHRLLLEVEAAGRSDVISFVAGGRAFCIHKPETFFKEIVPLYFRQSRLSSFKRQLNLYGFELITTGPARGGYYHDSFVQDKPDLCRKMRRILGGTKAAAVAAGSSSSKKEETESSTSQQESLTQEQ